VPSRAPRPDDLIVVDGYLGPGYGHRTEAGDRATRTLADEGITLEHTYTAKTVAALLDLAPTGRLGRVILYWHTYGGRPLDRRPAPLNAK
jgi:D-cysteine desulfhydrase